MYHDFHNNMETLEVQNETGRSRQFSCPVCKKKNWRSIETFRLHKSHCRGQDGDKRDKKEATIMCVDCGAEFSNRLEYRDHVRDQEKTRGHVTHVCPMHCGAAFSADTCLQHHVVRCFARQRLGPFSVVSCRDDGEMANNAG